MGNYIVSARKYRPTSFDKVVGQENLTQTLKNAITSGKLAHAFLFCGPRGVGKTTCARIFAKTINCLSPTGSMEACGQCESCKAFDEGRSFTIHELDAASNNGVDEIRGLIEQVQVPPQIGKYKVFIIDEVHMLTQAAFNAFLKTLEEPPAHAIFILATTEKHKILPTILSRCQTYDFKRMEVSDIVAHLSSVARTENISFEEQALSVIAQKADGGMRDALSIFDQVASFTRGNITYVQTIAHLNVLDSEYFFKITDNVLAQNIPALMLVLNDILQRGFDAQHFIGGLAAHFRSLLVASNEQTLSLIDAPASEQQRYAEQAKRLKMDYLYRAIKLCNDCDLNYRASRNKRLLVEITLIELAQALENPAVAAQKVKTALRPIFKKSVATVQTATATPATPKPMATTIASVQTISSPVQSAAVPVKKVIPGTVPPQSFSLKRTLQPQQAPTANVNNHQTPVEKVEDGLEESFTKEVLGYNWRFYLNSLPKEQAATTARLKNIIPEIGENNTIIFELDGDYVAECFETIRQHVLEYLKLKLRNSKLTIQVKILELKKSPKALTQREQWALLVQKNSLVAEMREMFKLELA